MGYLRIIPTGKHHSLKCNDNSFRLSSKSISTSTNREELNIWIVAGEAFSNLVHLLDLIPKGLCRAYKMRIKHSDGSQSANYLWGKAFCSELRRLLACPVFQYRLDFFHFVLRLIVHYRSDQVEKRIPYLGCAERGISVVKEKWCSKQTSQDKVGCVRDLQAAEYVHTRPIKWPFHKA